MGSPGFVVSQVVLLDAGTVRSNMTLVQVTTREDLNKYIAEKKREYGQCALCNKSHTFEKNFSFGKGRVPSGRLSNCPKLA